MDWSYPLQLSQKGFPLLFPRLGVWKGEDILVKHSNLFDRYKIEPDRSEQRKNIPTGVGTKEKLSENKTIEVSSGRDEWTSKGDGSEVRAEADDD